MLHVGDYCLGSAARWKEKAEVATNEHGMGFCLLSSLNAKLFEPLNLSQMTILSEGEQREGCRGGLTDDTLFPAS